MLIPVVLSGGSGTRLWPVSREASPKPFMRLGQGPSLLQRTVSRCLPLAEAGRLAVVTRADYRFRTQEEITPMLTARGVAPCLLLEPEGRNTAPAIAAAALWAQQLSPEATLLVLPADHLIPDEAAFQTAAREAARLARDGSLVLFGIRPTAPETGFGYIETGRPVADSPAFEVARFVEKPDATRAMDYLLAGTFLWNSGLFCFTASALIAALEMHAPDVIQAVRAAWSASPRSDMGSVPLDAARFAEVPSISIDYAVMERAPNVVVLPATFGWSDIGSWNAVAEQLPADEAGNTTVGDTVLIDSRNTHVQSEDRVVAAVGVADLLIVDTPDALLVAHKDAGQEVRQVVARLKAQGHEAATLHRTVARPWGSYTVLQEGARFKIKRIEVRPGHALSLQMHHHRSEHWIVVSGTAKVRCEDRTHLVAANESTFIPIGARHRLENPGVVDLVMIEVQCGDYLGEDDIVRFQDDYGRTP